eukprot:8903437-Lingulodinium_polyedra.AAC.1
MKAITKMKPMTGSQDCHDLFLDDVLHSFRREQGKEVGLHDEAVVVLPELVQLGIDAHLRGCATSTASQ